MEMTHIPAPRPHRQTREYVLGEGLRATVLTTSEETEGRHDLTYCRQPGGEATPLHLHTRYEERFWVLSGGMTVWAGDEVVQLSSGDYYAVERNVPHALKTDRGGCRALAISSPAGFAELIERTGTPTHLVTPQIELDMELFMAVSSELGDVVLGPPGTLPGDIDAKGTPGHV